MYFFYFCIVFSCLWHTLILIQMLIFFPALNIKVNKYSHKQKNILQISHIIVWFKDYLEYHVYCWSCMAKLNCLISRRCKSPGRFQYIKILTLKSKSKLEMNNYWLKIRPYQVMECKECKITTSKFSEILAKYDTNFYEIILVCQ